MDRGFCLSDSIGKTLTVLERKVAKAYLTTNGNGAEAARRAGSKAKDPKSAASEILHRPHVRVHLQTLMARKGLTDAKLLDVLAEGLAAQKVLSARLVGTDATEQTDDFVEVPDHPTRHKYLETGLKLRGHLTPDAHVEREGPLLIVTGPSHQTIVNAPHLVVTPPVGHAPRA